MGKQRLRKVKETVQWAIVWIVNGRVWTWIHSLWHSINICWMKIKKVYYHYENFGVAKHIWNNNFNILFYIQEELLKTQCHSYTDGQMHMKVKVKLLSRVRLFVTPWIAACQASLSITNSWSLPRLMSIESVMPSSHLILCHPLLLLPPIPPSIRVFYNQSTLHMRWPKYWSFSFSISLSNEYSGLTSFRIDWFDLLVVQGTLKSYVYNYKLGS